MAAEQRRLRGGMYDAVRGGGDPHVAVRCHEDVVAEIQCFVVGCGIVLPLRHGLVEAEQGDAVARAGQQRVRGRVLLNLIIGVEIAGDVRIVRHARVGGIIGMGEPYHASAPGAHPQMLPGVHEEAVGCRGGR